MIKSILHTILLFLICSVSYANVSLKGKLIDTDKKPIPYANIVIKNTAIGVISNSDGFFSINIPEEYQNSTLVFSSIGFKTKEIAIKSFKNSKTETIQLENSVVDLDEVFIKVKATNTNEIVQKAFDHYYDNFPITPFIGKAFLRHLEKTKTKYKWLVDAAIEVYDPGFNKHPNGIKLNIEEIKQSIDNRSVDTTRWYTIYWHQLNNIPVKQWVNPKIIFADVDSIKTRDAIDYMDNIKSNPYTLFSSQLNVIRQYKKKDAILDKRIFKKHNFKIESVLNYNTEEVYKIKISPKSPNAKLNKHYKNYVYPVGWIYIRAKDFAIIELEYTLLNSKKDPWRISYTGTNLCSSFQIKFIEIDHKMYPKHITLTCPKMNKSSTIFANNYKGIRTDSEDFYYEKQEIIFNEIITDNTTIAKNLKKDWNSNLFRPRPYNAEFWEKYSSMVETEEQKAFREALVKELSIKKSK